MTNHRLVFICAVLSFTGCAHGPTAQEDALGYLKMSCLMPVLHAKMLISGGPQNDAEKAIYFKSYSDSFLDAARLQKYIACLDEDRRSKDSRKYRCDAERWLKQSQDDVEKYKSFFSQEKQIVDVKETSINVDDKRAHFHRITTLRDGTQVSSDEPFDRLAK